MRLTGFSVRNYRGFADLTQLELRPLTLLFGYNSAGKSALLRWLPIVAASTDPEATSALALDTEAARHAAFEDLRSRYTADPTLSLGLRWRDHDSDEALCVQLKLMWDAPQVVVEHETVTGTIDGAEHALEATWDLDSPSGARRYTVTVNRAPSQNMELGFDGLAPRIEAFEHTEVAPMMNRLAREMRTLARRVHWLSAVRAVPDRNKTLGALPRRLATNGAGAGDFLAHDQHTDRRLLATVSQWFEQATGHSLDVRIHSGAGAQQLFTLVLTPSAAHASVQIPLPDTGEGMAQVLPVIVLAALARHGRLASDSILLVEHPELHLHPQAHAALAGLFCALTHDVSGVTTVLETHSENILLRVQLAIARGELRPDQVIVHWVRSLDEGPSVVDSITFDAMARPQGDWPPGVFSSDIRQARELLNLRRKEQGAQ